MVFLYRHGDYFIPLIKTVRTYKQTMISQLPFTYSKKWDEGWKQSQNQLFHKNGGRFHSYRKNVLVAGIGNHFVCLLSYLLL